MVYCKQKESSGVRLYRPYPYYLGRRENLEIWLDRRGGGRLLICILRKTPLSEKDDGIGSSDVMKTQESCGIHGTMGPDGSELWQDKKIPDALADTSRLRCRTHAVECSQQSGQSTGCMSKTYHLPFQKP